MEFRSITRVFLILYARAQARMTYNRYVNQSAKSGKTISGPKSNIPSQSSNPVPTPPLTTPSPSPSLPLSCSLSILPLSQLEGSSPAAPPTCWFHAIPFVGPPRASLSVAPSKEVDVDLWSIGKEDCTIIRFILSTCSRSFLVALVVKVSRDSNRVNKSAMLKLQRRKISLSNSGVAPRNRERW